MPEFDVYNLRREKGGQVDLDDAVFGAEVKQHLLWEAVRWQQAKRRVGTAKAKERGEVRGGGHKPYRQKGTGRARQGTVRAPQFAGGGVVFGPRPRRYGDNLPKKVRRGALRSAISLRAQEQRLLIVEDLQLESHKTRGLQQVLGSLGVQRPLLVDGDNDRLSLSSRNLKGVKYLHQQGLNVYDILKYDTLVLTRESALQVQGRLKP